MWYIDFFSCNLVLVRKRNDTSFPGKILWIQYVDEHLYLGNNIENILCYYGVNKNEKGIEKINYVNAVEDHCWGCSWENLKFV